MNCMACYLQSTRGLASIGKRFVSQFNYSSSSLSPSSFLFRMCQILQNLDKDEYVADVSRLKENPDKRTVHESVYDKNPDEHVAPTVVPDDVIQTQSEEYWAPHPQTGVFGPSTEQNPLACGERAFHTSAVNVPEDSVLEQKAFFRHLEDLEKPPPQP